jgi:penicillin amidase
MSLRSVLRALNILLVVVVAGAGFAVWWYGWRASPKTSGTLTAGVHSPVRIVRDARGAPHIFAGSLEDAFFAQGFVTAQDRLWQMDMLRRLAGGELSEIAGRGALETDTLARKMRLRHVADEQLRELPGEERALLAAYARGVNFYIENNRGRWGWEFLAMGYEPRPWRLADSLLAELQMDRTLTNSWETEIQKFRMLLDGDPEKVEMLYPLRSGREAVAGSNAWAVSGRFTATGKPILANDPHLELTIPSPWYIIQLQAPGLNVAGVSLVGAPGVAAGHNEHIAWGVTSLQFDSQDLYMERIDTRNGRYEFKGEILEARRETEVIPVAGERPAGLINLVTRHGPLFTAEGRNQMALRWAAAEPGPCSYPLLALDRARNWAEFRAALSRYSGAGLNFVYADRDGHIGLQVAGRLPLRRSFQGDVPLEGWTGKDEWDGFIPFEKLPSYFDPPSGRIVSANQDPFPIDTDYTVSGYFAAPYRQLQIQALLAAGKAWTPDKMLAVQKDVYSPFSHFLARQAVAAVQKTKAGGAAQEAASLLKNWNGQMEIGLAAPVVADLLYRQVRRRLAESTAPKAASGYRLWMAPWAVERMLRERPAGWFPNWDKMLADATADAYEEARRLLGRNSERWEWGDVNRLTIVHPVAARISWIAPYFNVGPLPMSGSGTTVKQVSGRLAPSMRFVADLADWDRSLLNLATGESGHFLSGHYKDQWKAWYVGESFPLEFTRLQGKGTLTLNPRSNP